MPYIPLSLQRLVFQRAQDRCEYCRLSQTGQEATFHIDHVHPVASGGLTTDDNLALACVSCSLRKSARELVEDPLTGNVVPIFNPRKQNWDEHFQWDGVNVSGLTAIGRATVSALDMNRPTILEIRREEIFFQRHPPPQN